MIHRRGGHRVGQTWTGSGSDEVSGNLTYTWTTDFNLHEESVQGGSSVTYGYEGDITLQGDGLLVSVESSSRPLTLGRDSANGISKAPSPIGKRAQPATRSLGKLLRYCTNLKRTCNECDSISRSNRDTG